MSLLDEILPAPERASFYPWTGNIGELPAHFSLSQMNQANRCLEQYRQVRVLHKRERPGAALIWGSADHAAHELNFAQKIDTHEDIPIDELEDAFLDAFDHRVDELGDEINWNGEVPVEVRDRGADLARLYHRLVSPSVQPTAVEREFLLELPAMPVPVVGRIDLETSGYVVERKTAKRKESKPKPDWRVQGLVYQLAAPKPLVWHVSAKTNIPAVYTQTDLPALSLSVSQSNQELAERMLVATAAHIEMLYKTLGPEQPWPGTASYGWGCDYCAFLPTCSWWH